VLNPTTTHEIRDWIGANLALAQSVKDVARHFGVDVGILRRRFQRLQGVSIAKLLTAVKVAEAERLARDTRLPLKEISTLTGLGRRENASRVFKSQLGVTFREYRRRVSGEKR
jgi:AraC-like DNA-binding protein